MPRRRKTPSREALLNKTLNEEEARLGRLLTAAEVDALVRRLRRVKKKLTSEVRRAKS